MNWTGRDDLPWVQPNGVDWNAISEIVSAKLDAGPVMDFHKWDEIRITMCFRGGDIDGNNFNLHRHLLKYKSATDGNILDCDSIVEIGGGYGEMCKLIRSLGFIGSYTLVDLPGMLRLQKYYLEAVCGIRDVVYSELLVPGQSLIATWSLSEADEDMRTKARQMMPTFTKALIAYQPSFGSDDNNLYFSRIRYENQNMKWKMEPAGHNNSFYLFGAKPL